MTVQLIRPATASLPFGVTAANPKAGRPNGFSNVLSTTGANVQD
jgi:hypothetical protein